MLDEGSGGGIGYRDAPVQHDEQISALKAGCVGDKEIFGSCRSKLM